MVVYLSHDLSHICHALGGFQGSTEKRSRLGHGTFYFQVRFPTLARDPAKEEPSSETFSYVNFSNVNFSNVLDVG